MAVDAAHGAVDLEAELAAEFDAAHLVHLEHPSADEVHRTQPVLDLQLPGHACGDVEQVAFTASDVELEHSETDYFIAAEAGRSPSTRTSARRTRRVACWLSTSTWTGRPPMPAFDAPLH